MANGKCPKCQSTDVFRMPVFFKVGIQPVHFAVFDGDKPITMYPMPQLCRSCGFVEMYLSSENLSEIQSIADDKGNWQRVS